MTVDALTWLFERQRFGMKPGLEATRALLERLGDPQQRFQSILVGGTNGKGSTASTLMSILNMHGCRTALFTSPHLTYFSERFLVDGVPLQQQEVLAALQDIRPHAEAVGATFFEIVTALGCVLFKQANVDVAVMEVGLGGRFDATNTLEPILSIITGVALDHTQVLGDTVEAIASEKAGIMRSGRPCLTGARGGALRVLQQQAEAIGAELHVLGEQSRFDVTNKGWAGLRIDLQTPDGLLELHTPFLGPHQARNVALAALAARHVGVEPSIIRQGVRQARWPGRLEPIRVADRVFLLDGAHNPEAAQALADALQALSVSHCTLIFGTSADKDVAGIALPLRDVAKHVVLTRAGSSPRALPPEELAPHWHERVSLTVTPREAIQAALAISTPDDLIVVAGSLYLLGEIRPILVGEAVEEYERWQ